MGNVLKKPDQPGSVPNESVPQATTDEADVRLEEGLNEDDSSGSGSASGEPAVVDEEAVAPGKMSKALVEHLLIESDAGTDVHSDGEDSASIGGHTVGIRGKCCACWVWVYPLLKPHRMSILFVSSLWFRLYRFMLMLMLMSARCMCSIKG